MSRNSKNAQRHVAARERTRVKGFAGAKQTTPKHGKKTRSKYNTKSRTGFVVGGKREKSAADQPGA